MLLFIKEALNIIIITFVQALRKTEMRKELRFALYDLLADATRPLPLRTTAFDLLLRYEDVDNARELIRLVKNENLKSLQAYMTTRINFLLETISPATTRYVL